MHILKIMVTILKVFLLNQKNEKDTSIVVEDNNNNFDENNELENTGIDDIVVGNITTDNDNIAVE